MINSATNYKKPVLTVLLTSGTAGAIGTVITQPLEVIKTRIQMQPILKTKSSIGIYRTIISIWQMGKNDLNSTNKIKKNIFINQRISIFWAGLSPSLWRCVPGIGLYFSSLNLIDGRVFKSNNSSLNNFLLGFTARSLVVTLLIPFTVIKVNAEAGTYLHKSTIQSLVLLYKNAGLFKGLTATLARDSPYSGIYLLFYKNVRKKLVECNLVSVFESKESSLAAVIAAILATTLTQPVDVLRVNRQLAGNQSNGHSWMKVFTQTIKVDGLSGLWRGCSLRLLRRAIIASITWTLFEKIAFTS